MLYIITAAHNRKEITKKFLDSLMRQTYQNFQLLLVDDGCSDGTAEMARELLPAARILEGDGNLWWAGALQKAYLYLQRQLKEKEDIIFISNDDNILPDDFLENGVRIIRQNPGILASGCAISLKDGKKSNFVEQRDAISGKGVKLSPGEIGNCTTTRAIFISAHAYLKIGGMHPFLLPHYYSDIEYTIRAARKGFPCACYEDLSFSFDHETTGNKVPMSLKEKFSKKCPSNPIYASIFLIMTVPISKFPVALWQRLYKKRR